MTPRSIVPIQDHEYEIIAQLQGGGQAEVYKVRDIETGQILAMKIARLSPPDNAYKPDYEQSSYTTRQVNENIYRIDQEIEFLSQLEDPEKNHIIQCLNSGQIKPAGATRSIPVFVMPFYENSLDKESTPDTPVKQLVKWFCQIATALTYIHQNNLAHRDLKAQNVLINDQGDITLIDFGITKQVFADEGALHTRMHFSDQGVAPEQVLPEAPQPQGQQALSIGSHNDIYAFSILMFKIMTGALPSGHEQFKQKIKTEESLKNLQKQHLSENQLGIIGGYTDRDKERLRDAFISRLSQVSEQNNPKVSEIADQFVSLASDMAHRNYRKRPTGEACLYTLCDLHSGISRQSPTTQTSTEIIESNKNNHAKEDTTPDPPNTRISDIFEQRIHWRSFIVPAAAIVVAFGLWHFWPTGSDNSDNQQSASKQSELTQTPKTLVPVTESDKPETESTQVSTTPPPAPQESETVPTSDESTDPELTEASTADATSHLATAKQYREGINTEINWYQAWQYYYMASEGGDDIAAAEFIGFEQVASNILNSDYSSPDERSLAYQVMEARANAIISRDNSHLWLAHRYREGDGITADPALAEYWQQRYDGVNNGHLTEKELSHESPE